MGLCSSTEPAPPSAKAQRQIPEVKKQQTMEFEPKSKVADVNCTLFPRLATIHDELMAIKDLDTFLKRFCAEFKESDFDSVQHVKFKNKAVYEMEYKAYVRDHPDHMQFSRLAEWSQATELDGLKGHVVIRRDVFVKEFSSRDTPLPRHQELKKSYPHIFSQLSDCKEGVYDAVKQTAFVSHRWQTPNQPDPECEQLNLLLTWLEANPDIKYIWYDFWCLPQKQRTSDEDVVFRYGLENANSLILQAVFCPLWSEDYVGRCWCYAELVWGFDRRRLVDGVNALDQELQETIEREYVTLIGKALLEGQDEARDYMDEVFSKKYVTSSSDKQVVIDGLLAFKLTETAKPMQMAYRSWFLATQGSRTQVLTAAIAAVWYAYTQQGVDCDLMTECLSQIGYAMQGLQEYQMGWDWFDRVEQLALKLYGDSHRDYYYSLVNKGIMEQAMRKLPQALCHLQKGLEIEKRVLGECHKEVAVALGTIGNVYLAMDEVGTAAKFHEQATDMLVKTVGPDHPSTGMQMQCQASVLEKLGRIEEAHVMYQKALDLFRASVGEHDSTADAALNAGRTLGVLGRHEEALALLEESHKMFAKVFDARNRNALVAKFFTVHMLDAMGRIPEALAFSQELCLLGEGVMEEAELAAFRTQKENLEQQLADG